MNNRKLVYYISVSLFLYLSGLSADDKLDFKLGSLKST